jgi:hypothetical protein
MDLVGVVPVRLVRDRQPRIEPLGAQIGDLRTMTRRGKPADECIQNAAAERIAARMIQHDQHIHD